MTNSYQSTLKSILLIARKHKLPLRELVNGFVNSWKTGEYHSAELTIDCRRVTQGVATFLITYEKKVVAQFPIELYFLRHPALFNNELQYLQTSIYGKRKRRKKRVSTINTLRAGMRGINLKALVVEVPPASNVLTRFGTIASVSNVKITDETGSIRLSLWNSQIYDVHVGDEIELKACHVVNYRGVLQLRLGRKGVLSIRNEEKEGLQKISQRVT
jgi:replication factor A1